MPFSISKPCIQLPVVQPCLPLTLAHQAFGMLVGVFKGEPRTVMDLGGAQLLRSTTSGVFSASDLVEVAPLSMAAKEALVHLCEVPVLLAGNRQ